MIKKYYKSKGYLLLLVLWSVILNAVGQTDSLISSEVEAARTDRIVLYEGGHEAVVDGGSGL
jgi:hypothetical protein